MYTINKAGPKEYEVGLLDAKNKWTVVGCFTSKAIAFMFINYLNGGPGDRSAYFAQIDMSDQ